MIDERFIFIGIALALYGDLIYLIGTIKGRTKPNKVTWFFWALAPLIAFAAEIQKGVGLVSLMTFFAGFAPLIIFIASFINKKSHWKLHKIDYFYGGLALLGIILWQITGEGNIAIFFSILADGFAAVPTVIKSYFNPESENSMAYSLPAINAGIALLTIKIWNFAHWGFPIYIFIICTIIYVLIKFKPGIVLQKKLNRS